MHHHASKMSKSEILKAFVNERLTATAVEIFGAFERTIIEYENELFRSKQEIERQRKLLLTQSVPQTAAGKCAFGIS